MEPETETIYLTPQDAAKLFGVSVSTLYRWVEEGEIPVLKTLGNHNRFPTDAIKDLLKEQQKKSKRKSKQ